MFSQKKKKSKGLLFIIPVLLVFLAGLGLNAFMSSGENIQEEDDRPVSSSFGNDIDDTDGKTVNKIPVYEYYNNAGLSQDTIPDADDDNGADGLQNQKNSGENHDYEGESYSDDFNIDKEADENEYYSSESIDENNVSKKDNNLNNNSTASGRENAYTGYKAVSENGLLVIYEYADGNVVSEQRTDIQTDILPEYDRKMLSEGINISSETGVEELLQDYEG